MPVCISSQFSMDFIKFPLLILLLLIGHTPTSRAQSPQDTSSITAIDALQTFGANFLDRILSSTRRSVYQQQIDGILQAYRQADPGAANIVDSVPSDLIAASIVDGLKPPAAPAGTDGNPFLDVLSKNGFNPGAIGGSTPPFLPDVASSIVTNVIRGAIGGASSGKQQPITSKHDESLPFGTTNHQRASSFGVDNKKDGSIQHPRLSPLNQQQNDHPLSVAFNQPPQPSLSALSSIPLNALSNLLLPSSSEATRTSASFDQPSIFPLSNLPNLQGLGSLGSFLSTTFNRQSPVFAAAATSTNSGSKADASKSRRSSVPPQVPARLLSSVSPKAQERFLKFVAPLKLVKPLSPEPDLQVNASVAVEVDRDTTAPAAVTLRRILSIVPPKSTIESSLVKLVRSEDSSTTDNLNKAELDRNLKNSSLLKGLPKESSKPFSESSSADHQNGLSRQIEQLRRLLNDTERQLQKLNIVTA